MNRTLRVWDRFSRVMWWFLLIVPVGLLALAMMGVI